MNKQTKALKMAIEALESAYGVLECEGMIPIGYESAIQVCKEALEQEQSFAEKTAQMSFMSLWDAYTTLKMKLEALEQPASKNIRESFNEMLEDKVAYYKGKQPAQEPVPLIRHENGNFSPKPSSLPNDLEFAYQRGYRAGKNIMRKDWIFLSDDEITNLEADSHVKMTHDTWEFDVYGFARAIEQALKEKNT